VLGSGASHGGRVKKHMRDVVLVYDDLGCCRRHRDEGGDYISSDNFRMAKPCPLDFEGRN
jgi:hypothetical protein